MSRNARKMQPLDAVDLEVVRQYMKAVETDLEHLQDRVATLRLIIEEVQGRNPARKVEW